MNAALDSLESKPWSRRLQEIGVIVWSSFLAACLASMLFFAFIDPSKLIDADNPRWWLPNVMTGYAIGFFFFWIMCAVAATITSYLLETLPRDDATCDSEARDIEVKDASDSHGS